MLRHKEPIFSPSTGRWPPETGPVAQRHRQQTIPGPGHQHQPAGGWRELSRRANREGAAGLPQTTGLGAAWLAQRGCPAVPVCTPAGSTRERSPLSSGVRAGLAPGSSQRPRDSPTGTDRDGFPWRHSSVTSTQTPVTNPACPQHSAPAAPLRDAPGSRPPSRPAAPSQLSASARLPLQGCSVPGASRGSSRCRGYPQHPPRLPPAPTAFGAERGTGLNPCAADTPHSSGQNLRSHVLISRCCKTSGREPLRHRPPGPCPTAPPSQGVPPLRASPLSGRPPSQSVPPPVAAALTPEAAAALAHDALGVGLGALAGRGGSSPRKGSVCPHGS